MIQRFTVAALLLACVIPAASRASAADDFLSLVPDAAAGFVVINQPAALDAKLQTLARQVQLPPMSPLTMLKMQFGLQEGVDENGTVLLLVLPAETEVRCRCR